MKRFFFATFFLLLGHLLTAQTCTAPAQTPATAFPVCGTSVFKQTTVPICGSHSLTVPGCSGTGGAAYADKNPYWYKFTCFKAGSLGFLISPVNQGDDYDWQLYDITGHNPDDVFTDASLIVTGNWAGTYGNTGASASGVNFIQCASDPADKKNSYSQMPNLQVGHTYLLLVSHFTDSQSGYDLSFNGGTAVITDTVPPAFKKVETNCGGDRIRLKLNKKIKCASLVPNGSDFFITPGPATITGVTGFGCAGGFDTDSIEIQLSSFLAPGTYSLNIKKGDDGNTLLDYCDNPVALTNKADFQVFPIRPTPMDSLAPVSCAPGTLRLVFQKSVLCSSIAADGTDFTVSGTYPVAISGAAATCNSSGLSKEVIINLSQPLYQSGSFTLTLKTGSDGSTLIDECGQQTPAGATLAFSVKDTVNADFTYEKRYGCSNDTINLFHPGGHSVNSWKWDLDDNKTSTLQNPQALYQVFSPKHISLVVSNGFCNDTSSQTVVLDNFLKADFSVYEDNCPNEPVNFTSLAQGHIQQHQWTFGDGGTSADASPGHVYTQPSRTTPFIVKYTVTDSLGCQSTAQKTIQVYSSCYLAVPNAFTPNNDGKNDFLRVLNAVKAEKLDFRIFNRWGQLVFQTSNWKQGWDGTIRGIQQATGVYVWFLSYTDRESKQQRTMRGTATLIR